jgi:glycosyltransferase 2 family protein
MKNRIGSNRSTVLQALGTLLAIGLLVALFAGQGWHEILTDLRQISARELILALVLFVGSRMAIVGRWHVLLRSGGVPIPLLRSTALTFTGLFASNFLPTTIGGDLVRLAGAMQMRYNKAVCLASIAADRLVGMAGMSLVLPFGLIPLANTLSAARSATLVVWWSRGLGFARRTLDALALWLRKPAALASALGFTLGHMLCLFLATSVILSALGESVPFHLIAGLWSVAYFITLVPVSINGYGLQELSLTWLFTQVAGVPLTDSLVLALVLRVMFVASSLPGAFYLPWVMAELDRSQP